MARLCHSFKEDTMSMLRQARFHKCVNADLFFEVRTILWTTMDDKPLAEAAKVLLCRSFFTGSLSPVGNDKTTSSVSKSQYTDGHSKLTWHPSSMGLRFQFVFHSQGARCGRDDFDRCQHFKLETCHRRVSDHPIGPLLLHQKSSWSITIDSNSDISWTFDVWHQGLMAIYKWMDRESREPMAWNRFSETQSYALKIWMRTVVNRVRWHT